MTDRIASRFHSLALASLGLALMLTAAPAPARATETIKVGFMAPLSGIFAQAGKDMLEGIKLAFEQIGYQTAGRKIELIEEDDEGNPAVAQAKYRKLVSQDRIHMLTGVLLSNIGDGLIPPIEGEARERAERRALRVIGTCFLLLVVYVAYESIAVLVTRRAPDTSTIGIVLAASSLIVMPILVHFKRRVARELGSGALEAEARQTRVCAYLSAILVVGLGLNAAFGWWWADPVAALGMAPLIAREGVDAVRGRTCCD